ncbi:MAG: leishmanolysin-related zinc metalloendopeptidase [Gemmatimonadales bacterium]
MIRRIAALATVLVLSACRADVPITPATPGSTLSIDPINMSAGDSVAPTIEINVGSGWRGARPGEVIVSSSDTNVIAVLPGGSLLAVGRGQSEITVALAANVALSVTQLVSVTSETLTGVAMAASPTMIPGDTLPITVTGTIRGGRRVSAPTSVSLASRNPAVVTISGDSAFAVGSGTAWLVATATSGAADSALVTVAAGAPVQVVLTPHVTSLVAGRTFTPTFAVTDRRGNAVAVTPQFASTSPAVATVQSDGMITAVTPGDVMIVASAGTGADTLRVSVTAPVIVLGRLALVPDSITLSPGGSASIQVQAFDTQGNPMAVPVVTWQSHTTGITVTSAGVVQAAASMPTTIPNGVVQVSSAGVVAQLRVAVVVPVLARLIVTPDSISLVPGGSATIQVQAIDNFSHPMTLPPLTWQSQTNGISVSSGGTIQAASTIATTITNGVVRVSSGAVSSTVRVAVTFTPPPPPTDTGYVQIRWVGAVPPADVAAAFETARQRINSLFLSFKGVAAIPLALPAEACLAGSPAINQTVNGIILFAEVAPIDGPGSILGSAGPCVLRSGTLLPGVGVMDFDSADMASMIANGTLNGVVLHEMMHTLGFGTIWGPGQQNEVASPNGADPRYIGSNGQAGYAAVGGTDASSGVPVENTGGSGTRGAHWRESVFRTELMTGWADGAMQMSRATVGALKDFGYDVDVSRADPYTVPPPVVGGGLVSSQVIGERTIAPIGVVGPDGKVVPIPR